MYVQYNVARHILTTDKSLCSSSLFVWPQNICNNSDGTNRVRRYEY